jgi:hypothetical protein
VHDDNVQILALKMNKMPDGDEKEILRTLFKNQHVIQLSKETDNLTGQ